MTVAGLWGELMSTKTYQIIRFYQDLSIDNQVIKTGLSLEEAQSYCKSPEVSSSTCSTMEGIRRTEQCGAWFEGYQEEEGSEFDCEDCEMFEGDFCNECGDCECFCECDEEE